MDTEQENADQISDADVFDAATAPEPLAEAPEATEERLRDEKGRFAAKEEKEETPPVVEEEPEVEPQKEERADHRIPLTELLNEREKRQAIQRQAEAYHRELEELRQKLNPPKPAPDQFQDPEGYNAYWEQRIAQQQQTVEQRFKQQEANYSLRLARMEHGAELFEKAYNAVLEDPSAAKAVAESPDPGQTLIHWYKREQALKEVGTDPKVYLEKKLEEALNDPKFLAKALDRAKGVASTQPTQVKLPPSLNKATSAARSDDTADLSDAGLYHHAIGR